MAAHVAIAVPGMDWRDSRHARLEASRGVNTGGSGLGLAIVRQLAMAQGWQAWLQARHGGLARDSVATGGQGGLSVAFP